MNQIHTYLKKRTTAVPKDTHYLITRSGLFMAVRSDWVDAVVPVEQDIEFQVPEYTLKMPLPGREIFGPVVRFFRTIYDLHHSEAAVLLHFNMAEQTWAFSVPMQTASMAHVNYEMTDRLPGYRCVGTMHSHGHMGASHSHVDTRDEANFDGLHITIGNILKYPDFDMDAELLVRGHRFKIPPDQFPGISKVEGKFVAWNNRCVLEGFADEADEPTDPAWIEKVKSNTRRNWMGMRQDREAPFLVTDVMQLYGEEPEDDLPRPGERDDS